MSEVVVEPFSALFQREFVGMVALAEAVSGDPSAAEDIAAEAFSRANRRWDRVGCYDKPGAWVRRVTINLALKRKRRLGLERVSLSRQRATDLVEGPPELDHPVWAAVAELPPKQRAAVALFYLEDLPVSEIAEILECKVSTATSHLDKGRKSLRQRLGGGDDS
ncbi:MAG: sigma-70 family RNA polymerase sigma factor [Acidimicrobiales bacterium]